MPVSYIPSSEVRKSQKTAYKRRRDQNAEISELEALLPWSQTQVKNAGIDKISVLRLTSAYIKFKDFWQSEADEDESSCLKSSLTKASGFNRLFSEAMDGFLLVLASNGEILYVSESILEYVGLTQQEVIGQPIFDITHEDDAEAIRNALVPKGVKPVQYRQLYMRFKSSIALGKKQLSKFGGHIMVQVTGNLKLRVSSGQLRPKVLGLVAECRRIESSSSILEISIPQMQFTSTVTMDLKILSIDTKMQCITGFNLSDIQGAIITDFLHPFDNKRSIHCLKTLLITGESVSPIIRFMTHTGEWVWVQIHGVMRYEKDNQTPKLMEATFKVVCSDKNGVIKLIEQKELYGRPGMEDPSKAGIHSDPRFKLPEKFCDDSPLSVVKALAETDVSEAVQDVVLHSREIGLRALPENMNRLAAWGEVADAVMAYEMSQGIETSFANPFPTPSTPEPKKPILKPAPLTSHLQPMPPLVTKFPGVPEVSAPAQPVILKEPEKTFAPCAYSNQKPPLTHVGQEISSGVTPPLQHIPYAQDPGVNLPISSHYGTAGMQAPPQNLRSSYPSFTSPSSIFSAGSNESGYASGQMVSPPSVTNHLPSPAGSTDSYVTCTPPTQGYAGSSPGMESVDSTLSQVPALPVNGMVYIPNIQPQQPPQMQQDSLSHPHLPNQPQPPSGYGYAPMQAPMTGSQVYHPSNEQLPMTYSNPPMKYSNPPMKYSNPPYYHEERQHPMMPPAMPQLAPQVQSTFTMSGTFTATDSHPLPNVSRAAPTEDEVMEILQQFMP